MTLQIVCNSTPLIALSKINRFYILQNLFETITIPKAVYSEVIAAGQGRAGEPELRNAGWIKTSQVGNRDLVDFLKITLDAGEAEAITLAKENCANLLIIDDGAGRRMAKSTGIPITGTVGLLMRYYRDDTDEFQNAFHELLGHGFRLNNKVMAAIIKQHKAGMKKPSGL